MRNIKLTIRYDGTNYAGWQSQKNAIAIQDVIEKALKKILGKKLRLTGAGRTDSGVHAKCQVANFRTNSRLHVDNIRKALNASLPDDIRIYAAQEAPLRFNAQLDSKSKIYRYTISSADILDPFLRRYVTLIPLKLNLSSMKRASGYIVGRHDFRSFQAKANTEKNSIRFVKRIDIRKRSNLTNIDIEADGFLRNMARNIAGTLIEVGRGKFGPEDVKAIIRVRNRAKAGPTAPAKGLCLIAVDY